MEKEYEVPFAFQMYGRIPVRAKSRQESIQKAAEELKRMTVSDMMSYAEYLAGSEEIDEDGIFYEDGQICEED